MGLDEIARRYGDKLQIRFYGHYNSTFDFRVLERLPHASNVAADCLQDAINFESLACLSMLNKLQIGVYNSTPKDILSYPSLWGLEGLVLSGAKKDNIDLSYLSKYNCLKDLFLVGFTKSIEVLAELKDLEKLGLSQISNKQSLSFINKIVSLRALFIILGGRTDIDEVVSPFLERLEIIRVRGLGKLSLENYVGLRQLIVEDQIQIKEIEFSEANGLLGSISINNCKGLSGLNGLTDLAVLKSLHLHKTNIEFDHLVAQGLPASLSSFTFYSNSLKEDAAISQKLATLGYK